MKLIDNWRAVLIRAWSVRLIAIAALLTGIEALFGLMDARLMGLPDGIFAAVASAVSASALAARLIAQNGLDKPKEGDDARVP